MAVLSGLFLLQLKAVGWKTRIVCYRIRPIDNKLEELMKIGILVGREGTFPQALIDEINHRNKGVTAEYFTIGGVRMAAKVEYDTIIDRISHEIPFYRAFLKRAVFGGTKGMNNRFWGAAVGRF